MTIYDVLILGGGAAGLMCAQEAGKQGKTVLIIEGSHKAGKKIIAAGGGYCNFTNQDVSADNYISANPNFCKSALSQFSQWDMINLVSDHQVAYCERKHGQLFCTKKTHAILHLLLDRCNQPSIQLLINQKVLDVNKNDYFSVTTQQGEYQGHRLVVATGGLSLPKMGASNLGYQIAEQFAHPIIPTRAGLVPFIFSDQLKTIFAALAGLSLPVTISTATYSIQEDLLFTHRGLSGPAVLQASNYWQADDSISINCFPHLDLHQQVDQAKQNCDSGTLTQLLSPFLAKRILRTLESLFWFDYRNHPISQLSPLLLHKIAHQLHNWQIKPAGTEGYRTAEVTLGGVDTHYISSQTMMSRHVPGLYFVGEVLDVTGQLGGYNLQWAWSSGYVAGKQIAHQAT